VELSFPSIIRIDGKNRRETLMGGLFAILGLEGIDLFAFVVSNLIGFLAGLYFMPNFAVSFFAAILISFHLFLAWLVITAKHESGISLPIITTILTHLACLVVVVAIGIGRHIPFFGIIRYCVPVIAIFERNWLFKGTKKGNAKGAQVPKGEAERKAAAVANAVAAAATVDDYQEWLKYLAQPNRPPRKPGTSVQDEYKQWLVARAKAKVAPPPRS
jgi:hypothetical protein